MLPTCKACDNLANHCLCAECRRWVMAVQKKDEHGSIRIGAVQYFVREDIPPSPIAVCDAILKEDGEIIITESLFRMGRIPEAFLEVLPDNAMFITVMEGES